MELEVLPVEIRCQRCGEKIPSLNRLRKWCVNCRQDLTNERARERNRAFRTLRAMSKKH